jgi:hypothetical protein
MKLTRMLLLAAPMLALVGCGDMGSGEKMGTIIKLATHGVFCTTYEAELIRGGMSNGSGAFGVAPFDFTIDKPELVAKVQAAVESQQEVKITYHEEMNSFCRSDSNSYFLTSIEPVKK